MNGLKSMMVIFYVALVLFLCVRQRVEAVRVGYIIVEAENTLEEIEKENRLLRLEYSRTVSMVQLGGSLPENLETLQPGSIEIIKVIVPRVSSAETAGETE